MTGFTAQETAKFERLFEMENGYVLWFSNAGLSQLVAETINVDIYDGKYGRLGNSKANRLRALWIEESSANVSKLNLALIQAIESRSLEDSYFHIDENKRGLIQICRSICLKLNSQNSVADFTQLSPIIESESGAMLIDSIRRESTSPNPQGALDRVHTLTVKYLRQKLQMHNIDSGRTQPLHSLHGLYVRQLISCGKIESEMTEKILRSMNPILEKYNDVRNNQSFAHDNSILNHSECVFILNSIHNAISYFEMIDPSSN